MTSTSSHLQGRSYELVVFDFRAPGAIERLLSEHAAWGEDAVVELLGPHHAVLMVRAGGATRMDKRRAA
jgi:hypothetical protein